MKRGSILFGMAALLELAQAPLPTAFSDSHILSIPYSADHVAILQATPGFALVVELSDDEHVENLVVGNGSGWQVTANKRGDHVIIKPAEGAPTTDLVVTTDVRRYVFLLHLADTPNNTPFVVHFSYPEEAPANSSVRTTIAGYKLAGDKSLFPALISDDGQRTLVSWGRATPLPAIYAVGTNGREALVNGRMVGGDYVIQGVAPRYVFRLGKAHATAERRPTGDGTR